MFSFFRSSIAGSLSGKRNGIVSIKFDANIMNISEKKELSPYFKPFILLSNTKSLSRLLDEGANFNVSFRPLAALVSYPQKICISVFMSKKRALTLHFILFFCQERRADFNISESPNLE